MRFLHFLDSFSFLNAGLDELTTTLKLSLTLDAHRIEDELFKKKLTYPYEIFQTIESL